MFSAHINQHLQMKMSPKSEHFITKVFTVGSQLRWTQETDRQQLSRKGWRDLDRVIF